MAHLHISCPAELCRSGPISASTTGHWVTGKGQRSIDVCAVVPVQAVALARNLRRIILEIPKVSFSYRRTFPLYCKKLAITLLLSSSIQNLLQTSKMTTAPPKPHTVHTTLNYYLPPEKGGLCVYYPGTAMDKRRKHDPARSLR